MYIYIYISISIFVFIGPSRSINSNAVFGKHQPSFAEEQIVGQGLWALHVTRKGQLEDGGRAPSHPKYIISIIDIYIYISYIYDHICRDVHLLTGIYTLGPNVRILCILGALGCGLQRLEHRRRRNHTAIFPCASIF